jgi:hypothetical protein
MGWECSANGQMVMHTEFNRKPEWKRPLWRRHRWEDNIKIDLK